MKTFLHFLVSVLLPILSFGSPAQAEEISTRAADLTVIGTTNQSSSNLLAQTPDPALAPTYPTNNSNPSLYEGSNADTKLPTSNYLYWSGSVGVNFVDKAALKVDGNKEADLNFDFPYGVNLALGYQWKEARAELEGGYRIVGVKEITGTNGRKNEVTGDISALTILLNGYYDIPTGSKLRPYLGLGVGLGFNDGNVFLEGNANSKLDIGGTFFTYQAKSGLQYEIAKKANIFAELKYVGNGSYKTKNNDLNDPEVDSLSYLGMGIGYRQSF